MRQDPPTEKDVRNAIERTTVSATRFEIVLNESVVAEGQDRVLTLPWTRTSSRRRREIIEGVGEAQQPLRAMRTKAREGFSKALRDAHRWLDELLFDLTQTIESLAVRESKSDRSIRMTLSLVVEHKGKAYATNDDKGAPVGQLGHEIGIKFRCRQWQPKASALKVANPMFDAPHLVDLEVAQVLRRYAAAGQISGVRGREALDDLAALRLRR